MPRYGEAVDRQSHKRGESSDVPGQLFTEYFLNEGIRATPSWRDLVASADANEAEANITSADYATLLPLVSNVGPDRFKECNLVIRDMPATGVIQSVPDGVQTIHPLQSVALGSQ